MEANHPGLGGLAMTQREGELGCLVVVSHSHSVTQYKRREQENLGTEAIHVALHVDQLLFSFRV